MKFCSFEERLAAQRREKELAKSELGFKQPLSKEEKIMKKKERLAAIGNSSGLECTFEFCNSIPVEDLAAEPFQFARPINRMTGILI